MSENNSLNKYLYNCMIYEKTHRATVYSILGENTPIIESTGGKFYNENNWVSIYLLRAICDWSYKHQYSKRKNKILKQDWEKVIQLTNKQFRETKRRIVIAQTPDVLDSLTINALIGGAYHEAWHTLYDSTNILEWDNIDPELYEMLNKLQWHKYRSTLEGWNNIIADIRIENIGTIEFPGTLEKMELLQEFIWKEEKKNLDNIESMRILMGCFRDIGFGYDTIASREILQFYQEYDNGYSYNFVTRGDLQYLLEQSKKQEKDDKLSSVRLSLKILETISKIDKENESEEQEQTILSENPNNSLADKDNLEKEDNCEKEDSKNDISDGKYKNILEENKKIQIFDYAKALEQKFEKTYTQGWAKPEIIKIEKIKEHEAAKKGEAKELFLKIKKDTAGLKIKLKNKLMATKEVTYNSYVNTGITLSENNLINTVVQLKNRNFPNNPYIKVSSDREINSACGIGLDFSASMVKQYKNLVEISLLITDSLEYLGCKTFIYSFQTIEKKILKHLIFKEFEENFNYCINRFSSIRFNLFGTTPTGDAVKFGKECLNRRFEEKKFLFIVTDGLPNIDQIDLLERELDNSPIPVIGVGIGEGTEFVKTKFKNYAWAKDLENLPNEIIKVIYKVFK